MDITTPILIFSGDNKAKTYANEIARALDKALIDYKQVIGAYKYQDGTVAVENSFVVYNTKLNRDIVNELCAAYDQESYLMVDANRQAALVYLSSGRTEELGRFKATSEAQALKSDAYTFDPTTKTYYVTK